ncbi:MAG: exopolysaccharide Pel transporter PelG [Sporomusaceae bacterium]|jgi:uncharacterized membrane protein|nr:exopolysaccharide Pel transporter PelG [Sporomusaceae bacterium]
MAGIGFELKRLFHKKSALSYFRAYFYTMIVTVGPFVMLTGLILFTQQVLKPQVSYAGLELYVMSIVYPFIFSQIIASGFAMLITRFISDRIYAEEYEQIVPSLLGITAFTFPVASLLALWFFWDKPLALELKLVTYILYMELIFVWIQGVYLSALKDYLRIVKSYFYGIAAAVAFFFLFLHTGFFTDKVFGALLAMDIGFFLMALCLMLQIRAFFPAGSSSFFSFLPYLDTHLSIFSVNFFYTAALYIPNIIIWQGPWGVTIAGTYIYAPIYDVATFFAFLSILPTAVVFVVFTEVAFYPKYTNYVTMIVGKGNYQEIEDARKNMSHVLWSQVCHIVELQLVFALIFLALGNFILTRVGLSYASINVYNLIVLGAFANGILQVVIILLLYLEDRRGALYGTAFFLAANTSFNLLSLYFGENTYGFGFFAAAFLSLVVTLLRLNYYMEKIDYYIYCTMPVFNNIKPGIFTKIKNAAERTLGGSRP